MCVYICARARFVWPRVVSFGPARLGSVSRVFFTSRTRPRAPKPLETEFRACSSGEKMYSCAGCSEAEKERGGKREEKKKKKKRRRRRRRRRNKRKEEGVSELAAERPM